MGTYNHSYESTYNLLRGLISTVIVNKYHEPTSMVWDLGFRGLGFGFRAWGLGFGVSGLRFAPTIAPPHPPPPPPTPDVEAAKEKRPFRIIVIGPSNTIGRGCSGHGRGNAKGLRWSDALQNLSNYTRTQARATFPQT